MKTSSIRVPKGLALRPYQQTGVKHLLEKQRKLLFDDVGLGKTCQALVAINTLGAKRTLVICPPATRYGWEREAKKWTDRNYKVHVMTKEVEVIPDDANIVIVSYSLLKSPMIVAQLKETRWPCCIIDEIHWLKESKAQRTKTVLGRGGIITKCVYVFGLTATAMNNAPIDLWQIFRSMGKEYLPTKASDWMGYTKYFCKRYKDRFGRFNVKGAANLDVLNKCLYNSGFALRRTKDEVLKELPEKQVRVIPMTKCEEEVEIKWSHKLSPSQIKLGLDASEIAEARRELGESKLDATVEYIKSIDEPTVIFGWHREFLEVLAADLKGALYYGGMTLKQKEINLKKFTEGKTNFLVANLASAGTGLDGLQHRASRCVVAELPWTYAELDQATGRLHRMGQKQGVLVDIPCVYGGIEEYILQTVLKKQKLFKEVIDKEQELLKIE